MENETLKTIIGIVVRWSLKFVGPFLAANGISESSYLEVGIGLLMFAVGAVISLVMRKKDLATPPPA